MYEFPGYKYVRTLQEKSKSARNIVILCECEETKELVAIKLIEITERKYVFPVDNEVEILKNIPKHENIVGFITSFRTDEHIALVLEYVPNSQDLFDFINDNPRLKVKEALGICAQLNRVINHLHQHNICHGDIKPENILIEKDTNKIKLLDFEFASCKKYSSNVSGSPHYLSPEKWRRKENFDTHAADMWSLGVTFYVILTGTLPFNGQDNHMTMRLIKKGKYPQPKEEMVRDFFSCILQMDPEKRVTADELQKHEIWKSMQD